MEARKLQNKATWFIVVREELYHREVLEGAPLQLCILVEVGESILRSARCGTNNAHQGGCTLAQQ